MQLVPELETMRQELDAATLDAQKLAKGLSEEQLAWRPEPGRWSIAEVFIHLNLATQVYLPAIDSAIEDAKKRNLVAEGPFGLGLMGKLFVWYMEPPVRTKSKAPRMIKPLLQGPAADALPQFLRSQELIATRLEAANGLDLGRARFVSPLASAVRLNLLAPFAVLTAHQRRHLWQGWNVRSEMEKALSRTA